MTKTCQRAASGKHREVNPERYGFGMDQCPKLFFNTKYLEQSTDLKKLEKADAKIRQKQERKALKEKEQQVTK